MPEHPGTARCDLNADDLGAEHGVNQAILQAFQEEVHLGNGASALTACSHAVAPGKPR
jgi:hypothetical protein